MISHMTNTVTFMTNSIGESRHVGHSIIRFKSIYFYAVNSLIVQYIHTCIYLTDISNTNNSNQYTYTYVYFSNSIHNQSQSHFQFKFHFLIIFSKIYPIYILISYTPSCTNLYTHSRLHFIYTHSYTYSCVLVHIPIYICIHVNSFIHSFMYTHSCILIYVYSFIY